jgi:hypothetical protein
MSKKSAYRRRRPVLTTYQFSARTWDTLRARLRWPETGEPVSYAACLRLRDRLEAEGETSEFFTLVILVIEAWRHSYPQAPQGITLSRD